MPKQYSQTATLPLKQHTNLFHCARSIAIYVFIIVAIVALTSLVAAIFVKRDFSMTISKDIDRPTAEVFDYVKQLKHQPDYLDWLRIDPDMKLQYSGVDGTPMATMKWSSELEDVGKGEQQIVALKPNERIDYVLRFKEPVEATEQAYMLMLPEEDDKTRLVWHVSGHFDYPMNLSLLIMDFVTLAGGDYNQELDGLKNVLEDSPQLVLNS